MFTPIPLADFRARTGITNGDLSKNWHDADRIASLRDVKHIHDIKAMSVRYLSRLLEHVPLAGDSTVLPYKDCRILTAQMDPNRLRVGQTFVERRKYQAFIEEFEDVFDGYCMSKGPAKCTPLIILGEDNEGAQVVAHYLPPIVEVHDEDLLVDGMHRNYLGRQIGTTLESIIIKGVKSPFPCSAHEWSAVRAVAEKPPKNERFFNLQPDLFRDLKFIGIDG